jgi:hypothetical protein
MKKLISTLVILVTSNVALAYNHVPLIDCENNSGTIQIGYFPSDNSLSIDYSAPQNSNNCAGGCGAQIEVGDSAVSVVATLNSTGIPDDKIEIVFDKALLKPGHSGHLNAGKRGSYRCQSTIHAPEFLKVVQ